nr:hypothetical protein [Pandoravirus massiliensis]
MERRAGPPAAAVMYRHAASARTEKETQAAESTRDQTDQLALLMANAKDSRVPLDRAFYDIARHKMGLGCDSFARLLRDALDDIQRQIAEEKRIQEELKDRLGNPDNEASLWDFFLSCWGARRWCVRFHFLFLFSQRIFAVFLLLPWLCPLFWPDTP